MRVPGGRLARGRLRCPAVAAVLVGEHRGRVGRHAQEECVLLELAPAPPIAVRVAQVHELSAQCGLLIGFALGGGHRALAGVRFSGDGVFPAGATLRPLQQEDLGAVRSRADDPDQRLEPHASGLYRLNCGRWARPARGGDSMEKLPLDLDGPDPRRGLSTMSRGLVGSEILRIAAEIRAAVTAGQKISNFTVGDFSSREFPIPDRLRDGTLKALAAGETNYPPSDGVLRLREAVREFWRDRLDLEIPLESVVIAGGSRPVIYATYRALIEPGDTVVYPVPSWNNNHYCHLVGAKGVPLETDPEHGFLPTAASLRPELRRARLIALNTPLNPAGTVLSPEEVGRIAEAVVAENRRRERSGEKPLYLLYDQVYWMLTFGSARHDTPVHALPEAARYTIFVDGISKSFAATGVRVGWCIGPRAVIAAIKDILGHVGAWAPRAEQVATAELLRDAPAVDAYLREHKGRLQERLDRLHQGFTRMARAGLPVRDIPPQGAIYLSVQFDLIGKRGFRTNDQVRKYLLDEAGFAMVPFQAFGLHGENGWFRLSVGAVSVRDVDEALPRVEAALRKAVA